MKVCACGKCHSQQIKKDGSDDSDTNYLETRNTKGEENKQEHKPRCVDNQSVDTHKGKKGWGRSYGY